jgi:serine/threonine-protein kinase
MLSRPAEARARVRVGRYTVVSRIGRGGMGTVYRARDEALEREVALKTLNAEAVRGGEARRRFEVEAKAAARLSHPNIVTVYELGEERGVPFIAMEMLRGVDLEAALRTPPPLGTPEKLLVLVQLCRGLAYAHAGGIVHRDVKPSNVRLLEDGTAKIMDFGIAKLGGTHLTRTGMMVGTVHYMSPEQVRGRPLDGRSDVFSTGVILYEMLAGQKPFRGEGPTQVLYRIVNDEPEPLDLQALGGVGERLQATLARALAKDPASRYAGADVMADDLQRALDEIQQAEGGDARAALREAVLARRTALPRAAEDDRFPELEATFAPPRTLGDSETFAHPTVAVGTTADETQVAPATADAPPAGRPLAGRPARRGATLVLLALAGLALAAGAYLVREARPPVPAEVRIGVRSQPTGAAVLVDGRDSGVVTNGELVLPSGGPREVTLTFRKAGHRDETRSLRLPLPGREGVSVALEAEILPLRVTSDPPGATVQLDGEPVAGRTPLELVLDGDEREHRLVVALDGYEPREVVVARGERPASLELALEKQAAAGTVTVRSSYPLEVQWRGRSLARGGVNPRVSVPSGRQVLTLLAPSVLLRADVAVQVAAGRETQLDAPALGRLNVRATPDNCEVLADGTFLDYPPILDRPAVAGRHVIRFRWPDGTQRDETVEVRAGTPAFVVGRKE